MFLLLISDFPFKPNVKIDDKTGAQEQAEISIATTQFKSLSSWVDNGSTGGNWYDVSLDTTKTWNVDKNNIFGNSDCCDPVVKEYNGTFHIVWLNNTSITYRKTTDFGNTFSTTKTLSTGSLDHPWMAIKKDTIAIIFTSYSGSSSIIRVACSFDGGNNWTVVNIPNSTNGAVPIIATDKNKFWGFFWGDDPTDIGIWVSTSTDCSNWTSAQKVAVMSYAVAPNPYPQGIHADGYSGRVLNAYMHTKTGSRSDWRVYILRYNLIGWDTFMVAPNGNNSIYYMPAITFDPYGTAHLFYFYKIANKKWALFHSYSVNFGSSWSNPIRVSDTTFEFVEENDCGSVDNVNYNCWPGHYIEAYADSQNVYVAWADNRTGYFHVYSTYARINDLVVNYSEKLSDKNIKIKDGKLFYISDKNEVLDVKIYKVDGSLIHKSKINVKPGENEIYKIKGLVIVKINDKIYKVGGF
ncbi:MAG: sialidase family protein [candidate division WOR-3 bacterium]